MFIETVPNRNSPPAVLLRESYRDDHGRSQKRTLANLSKLPGDIIDSLKALLKGGTVIGTGPGELLARDIADLDLDGGVVRSKVLYVALRQCGCDDRHHFVLAFSGFEAYHL